LASHRVLFTRRVKSERGRAILSGSSEAELVARARAGEVTAFEAIVAEYEPKLVRFIYGLTRERELAEDLCQDTFISAYRALPEAPPDLKLSAWLYKIALNKVRSEKRRKRPLPWFGLPFFGKDNDSAEDQPPPDLPDPHEGPAATVVERDIIMKTLNRLPPDQATAILMDAHGYDDEEIAATLDCRVGAVRQKLFRGRKAFKAYYSSNE
jgi:RNA polymerase sigma-70 factor (ECF subfamily)